MMNRLLLVCLLALSACGPEDRCEIVLKECRSLLEERPGAFESLDVCMGLNHCPWDGGN